MHLKYFFRSKGKISMMFLSDLITIQVLKDVDMIVLHERPIIIMSVGAIITSFTQYLDSCTHCIRLQLLYRVLFVIILIFSSLRP